MGPSNRCANFLRIASLLTLFMKLTVSSQEGEPPQIPTPEQLAQRWGEQVTGKWICIGHTQRPFLKSVGFPWYVRAGLTLVPNSSIRTEITFRDTTDVQIDTRLPGYGQKFSLRLDWQDYECKSMSWENRNVAVKARSKVLGTGDLYTEMRDPKYGILCSSYELEKDGTLQITSWFKGARDTKPVGLMRFKPMR